MSAQKIKYTMEKEKLDFVSIKTLDRITVEKKNFDKLLKDTLFRKRYSKNPAFKTKPVVKNGVIHYIDTESNMDRCIVFSCKKENVRIEQYILCGGSVQKLSAVVFKVGKETPADCVFMNLVSEISCPVSLGDIDKNMYYQMFEFPVSAYVYIVDYLNSVRGLCETRIKDSFILESGSSVFLHKININEALTCYTQREELAKLLYA